MADLVHELGIATSSFNSFNSFTNGRSLSRSDSFSRVDPTNYMRLLSPSWNAISWRESSDANELEWRDANNQYSIFFKMFYSF